MYCKSHCRAQMKKSVTYEIKICVTKAGVIDETQLSLLLEWDQMPIARMSVLCFVDFWIFPKAIYYILRKHALTCM